MSEDWTRRDFLRTSAAVAAALAAGGTAFADPSTTQPKAKTPRVQAVSATTQTKYSQVKVGFVGCGNKGNHNLHAIADCGATIAALCDIDANVVDKASESFPNAKKYADFRKMLEAQKDLDAVVVSTPDHTHAVAAMMAMKMGKHVYCEKPLTHDIFEARTITETARKMKIATQMGNQGHSSTGSAQQVAWVRSGIIGNIKEVHVWTDRPIWPQGCERPSDTPAVPPTIAWDLWLGPAAERPYNPVYLPFSWRGWWDFGTGALGDMACHIMDAPYWALNLTNPTSVEAFSDGSTKESPPKWSVIRYEFAALADRPALKMYWYDGHLLPPNALAGKKGIPGDNGIIYVGEKGAITAQLNSEPAIVQEKLAKDFTPPTTNPAGHKDADRWHHQEFLEACLGGPKPGSNFDYAGPLSEVVLLGNLAIRTGRRIEWDAPNMKCTNVPEANQYVKREYRKGWEL